MNASDLKPGIIVRGPVLPEPIEVLVVTPLGDAIKIVGAGQKSGQVHQRVLRLDQLQFLDATPEREPFYKVRKWLFSFTRGKGGLKSKAVAARKPQAPVRCRLALFQALAAEPQPSCRTPSPSRCSISTK